MLLPELWHLINELLDNKELNIMKQVSKHFDIDMILKARRLNYPRINKCKTHRIPFTNERINNDKELVLKYLYNIGVDLIKGDLIVPNDNLHSFGYHAIYDGYKLITYFYSWFEPNELDSSFDIIRDKVPFDYWDEFECYTINIDPYRNECIDNIKYDRLGDIVDCHPSYNNHYMIYTTFTADKIYMIVANDGIDQKNVNQEMLKFKEELQQNIFTMDSDYGPNTLMI